MKVHVQITVTTNDNKLISCQDHTFKVDYIDGNYTLDKLGPLLKEREETKQSSKDPLEDLLLIKKEDTKKCSVQTAEAKT